MAPPAVSSSDRPRRTGRAPAGLEALATLLSGLVHLPGTAGYAALNTPYNLAATSAPVAVVEVLDVADVAAVMRFAGDHRLDVEVRATGHGAVLSDRPTLLVHTGRLDQLTIGPDRIARVGAGVRWRAVLDAAGALGLAAPAGSAPEVGVVGYLTGGGLGPVARTIGYSSDLVTAFDVVTGDGVVRRATASENPDLFLGAPRWETGGGDRHRR